MTALPDRWGPAGVDAAVQAGWKVWDENEIGTYDWGMIARAVLNAYHEAAAAPEAGTTDRAVELLRELVTNHYDDGDLHLNEVFMDRTRAFLTEIDKET